MRLRTRSLAPSGEKHYLGGGRRGHIREGNPLAFKAGRCYSISKKIREPGSEEYIPSEALWERSTAPVICSDSFSLGMVAAGGT